MFIKAINKRRKFARCYGKIVGFHNNTAEVILDSNESVAISLVIKYEVNGKNYNFIGGFYSTKMKIGGKVNVLYDVNDNSKANIEKGMYFAPIITSVLAMVFLIIVITYCFLTKNIPF